MSEALLRVASCSLEGDKGTWELVLTDRRSIFVNHGKVKTPSPWWALAGGAGGYALGFLLANRDKGGSAAPQGPEGLEAIAQAPGNAAIPHATVRRAMLEKGFAVWKLLTLEHGDPVRPHKVRAYVAAPESYVEARRGAGLGRLAAQREFVRGFRDELWRILPPKTIAKDKWE